MEVIGRPQAVDSPAVRVPRVGEPSGVGDRALAGSVRPDTVNPSSVSQRIDLPSGDHWGRATKGGMPFGDEGDGGALPPTSAFTSDVPPVMTNAIQSPLGDHVGAS